MPRTKLNKNGLMKRNRRNSLDEKKEEFIREYEIEVENMMTSMQTKYNKDLEDIDREIADLKSKIPPNILSMKWGDVENLLMDENYNILNNKVTIDTTIANLDSTIRKATQKADEGYITEETSVTSTTSGMSRARTRSRSNSRQSANKSVLGPLPNVRSKRSMSAGGRITANTPGPRSMMSAKKTPLIKTNSDTLNVPATHSSRSKYRTPLKVRQKAASADRVGVITPKVQLNTPLAILRHARAGETVFSLSGSPVVTNNSSDTTANVNIPMANGMLNIRPAELTSVDPKIIDKIDNHTLTHLKQLKANLDLIMKNVAQRQQNF